MASHFPPFHGMQAIGALHISEALGAGALPLLGFGRVLPWRSPRRSRVGLRCWAWRWAPRLLDRVLQILGTVDVAPGPVGRRLLVSPHPGCNSQVQPRQRFYAHIVHEVQRHYIQRLRAAMLKKLKQQG